MGSKQPTKIEKLIRKVKNVRKSEVKALEEIEFLALSIDERKSRQQN